MSSQKSKPVLGLVGAIGAGKSVVANLLAARGGAVVDADELGHSALERPDVKAQLVARWGDRVLKPDGTVNRRSVGSIVFADPAERKALEVIVFPVIGAMAAERIAAAEIDPTTRLVVLDAAVMLEAGWAGACDKVLYVDAPRDVRLARVANRGWSAADLAAREAAQMPATEKIARADAVLVNDGAVVGLEGRIAQFLKDWGWA